MFRNLISLLRFLLKNRRKLGKIHAKATDDHFALSIDATEGPRTPVVAPTVLLQEIESDIDTFWRTVPFQTLFLNFTMPVESSPLGGTCSDRAILFLKRLQQKYGPSLNARLHRARIQNRETHTVILVNIDSDTYLIDVGANWPVMRLIPCFKPFVFDAFGISFRSKPEGSHLHIEMKRPEQTHYKPFVELNLTPQSADYVAEALKSRYVTDNNLPFADGLRFAFVHEDSFYFLKENNLFGDVAHRKKQWTEYRISACETTTKTS